LNHHLYPHLVHAYCLDRTEGSVPNRGARVHFITRPVFTVRRC